MSSSHRTAEVLIGRSFWKSSDLMRLNRNWEASRPDGLSSLGCIFRYFRGAARGELVGPVLLILIRVHVIRV